MVSASLLSIQQSLAECQHPKPDLLPVLSGVKPVLSKIKSNSSEQVVLLREAPEEQWWAHKSRLDLTFCETWRPRKKTRAGHGADLRPLISQGKGKDPTRSRPLCNALMEARALACGGASLTSHSDLKAALSQEYLSPVCRVALAVFSQIVQPLQSSSRADVCTDWTALHF